MPISPLQLPDAIRPAQVDWTPLSQLGDVFAASARRQKIAETLASNTGPGGALDIDRAGASLARLGLLDEARPFLALAQQKAHLAQSAAGQAETSRHNRAMEGIAQAAEARQAKMLESRPELIWQENDTGQKVPYLVDARRGSVAQVPVPGLTDQPAANPYAVGGKMTEVQNKDALYASRMLNAEQTLTDPAVVSAAQSRMQRGYAATPVVGNSLVSPEYQKFDQASRDLINAILRRESGAAISESEFDNAKRQYLPAPGDSPEVLAQKAQNRRAAIEGFASGAGKAYRPKMIFDEGGKLVPNPALGGTRQQNTPSSQPLDPQTLAAYKANPIAAIARAQAAIKAGKDPAAVKSLLQQMGIDPARAGL